MNLSIQLSIVKVAGSLVDADELDAEGGVLDTFKAPPLDVKDDLSGVFLLVFLMPDVSSTRRLLSLSGRFLAMKYKPVLNVRNKKQIDRAARISNTNRRKQ